MHGPPGFHGVAVRNGAQSNGIARLSNPPHDAPMPNSLSALMNAYDAASGIGLRMMLNRPDAPVKSRFQSAPPGPPEAPGGTPRATGVRVASHWAPASADC